MTDYISREAAIEMLYYNADERCSAVVSDFEEIPAADVDPVRHGRWLDCEAYNDIEQCSECGMIFSYPSYYGYKFCPHCGAKMDGGV